MGMIRGVMDNDAFKDHLELCSRQWLDWLASEVECWCGSLGESAAFEPFHRQPESGSIPYQELDPSSIPAQENEHITLIRVALERAADKTCQGINATAHIDMITSDENAMIGEAQHRTALKMVGRLTSRSASGIRMLAPWHCTVISPQGGRC
jgi:hypothetical protein